MTTLQQDSLTPGIEGATDQDVRLKIGARDLRGLQLIGTAADLLHDLTDKSELPSVYPMWSSLRQLER